MFSGLFMQNKLNMSIFVDIETLFKNIFPEKLKYIPMHKLGGNLEGTEN